MCTRYERIDATLKFAAAARIKCVALLITYLDRILLKLKVVLLAVGAATKNSRMIQSAQAGNENRKDVEADRWQSYNIYYYFLNENTCDVIIVELFSPR